MKTRRERLEAKLAKRAEWAASRQHKAAGEFQKADRATDGIPLGQPILVDHYSARRHRSAIAKQDGAMRRGIEHADKAKEHASKAAGLSTQLEGSIFSDDVDAAEQLRQRIAEREGQLARRRAINAAWRKAKTPEQKAAWSGAMCPPLTKEEKEDILSTARAWAGAYGGAPYPPYSLTNIGANIRRDRKRLSEVERRLGGAS
ncbi:MAG: DUF3560 domain-containing protein [Actinomycetota bacterium]|nr:DUF3560 domain-containing protein [Actinomycetota bacterium]